MRIDGRSVDFNMLEEQKGDDRPGRFSFLENNSIGNQRSCYLAFTNKKVHNVLRNGFEDSPLFNGRIAGTGPRYCPSIEDKIDDLLIRININYF